MLSASRTACLIDATVESMLTITPFFRPRDGWVPMPMMSRPSGPDLADHGGDLGGPDVQADDDVRGFSWHEGDVRFAGPVVYGTDQRQSFSSEL